MPGRRFRRYVFWMAIGVFVAVGCRDGYAVDACRRGIFEGEVTAGKLFEQPIGGGLKVMLEPLQSGWILRVLPASGPRGQHDYAELATPPYRSVSPLLIGTDFSFRAQDAVAWNPRRFHFAANASEFRALSEAYDAWSGQTVPSAESEARLATLAATAPEGVLEILDAEFVPGTADQAGTAAMVASHFSSTPHRTVQPENGRGSALGYLTRMRFRVALDLPAGFHPVAGVRLKPYRCR